MTDTQVYGVVLPLELAQKARVVAAIEGKSRSRLIRDLLINYLDGYDGFSNVVESAESKHRQQNIKDLQDG